MTENLAYPCIQMYTSLHIAWHYIVIAVSMRRYNRATLLKTYHLYEQATSLCACECMFTVATTEDGCPVE